jgi:hypothetical protein
VSAPGVFHQSAGVEAAKEKQVIGSFAHIHYLYEALGARFRRDVL